MDKKYISSRSIFYAREISTNNKLGNVTLNSNYII